MKRIVNNDLHLLEKRLKQFFPDKIVSFCASGWTSYAFSLFGKNDEEKIVRIPRQSIKVYERESVILSFLVKKFFVPIPKTIVVHGDDGFSFAIHTKIKGCDWNLLTYNKLNETSKDAFCSDVALFFSQLHKIDFQKLSYTIPVKNLKRKKISYDTLYTCLKKFFREKEIKELYKSYVKYFKADEDLVFVHRDFHEKNSLVNKDHRLSGVFDFADAGIGNRASEFVSLYYRGDFEMINRIIDKYNCYSHSNITYGQVENQAKLGDVYGAIFLLQNEQIKLENEEIFDSILGKIKDWIR